MWLASIMWVASALGASQDWTNLGRCVGEHALAGQFELKVNASVVTPERGQVEIRAGQAEYSEEGRLQIDVAKGSWKMQSLTTQAHGSLDHPVETEVTVAGRTIPVRCSVGQ